jgi:VWFA-related protein
MSPTTFAAALALAAAVASGQQPAPPPFTAAADLIVVPVVVLDRKGATVQGLKVEDFRVAEDGRPVAIETFVPPNPQGATAEGRFIVIVLDNLRTRAELGPRVQTIARKFADRMGPSDVISAVTLNAGRSFTTSGPAEVRAAIARFRPAFGDTIRDEADDARRGLEAISQLTQQMAKSAHRRKVLVFIGAPSMFSPNEASAFHDRGPELSPLWFEAIRSTARDAVSVYVIDPEGQTGQVEDYSQSFAAETGGAAWVNTNNFDGAIDRIWLESGSYYLLGYPAPINDHRIHKIDVRVAVPGVTIRARRARG